MKKLKLVLMTCVVAAAVAACSTPAPTAVIAFNYEIDNARANGIVQVFDLSGNTVVHIRDLNPKTTKFLNKKNAPIPFKVVGENAVLSGMHDAFTVSTKLAASKVIRKTTAPAPAAVPVIEATAATPMATQGHAQAPDSDAAVLTEIARMRKELAELKAILAAAAAREAPATNPTAVEVAQAEVAEPRVVIVGFPNNSQHFTPGREQRQQLMALSQGASSIAVRGYTDSEVATPSSIALARARAEAAKRYLVAIGVTSSKITVSYDGAGKFIAENRTASGRAVNRRVEIAGT